MKGDSDLLERPGAPAGEPARKSAGEPGVRARPTAATAPWPDGVEPTPSVSSPDEVPPFRSLGFTLSTIGYSVARRFREILAPLELEPREFALLRAVAASEGQSQQAIGERLQIPSSRMVAFIDALEARGMIERRANPHDRRARALHLTEVGRETLGQAFALAVAHEQSLCAGLSDAQREQLLDVLQIVSAQLGLPAGVHAAMRHSTLGGE